MSKHKWHDWEMLETLRIAGLARQHWPQAIATLTQTIRRRTDPEMDEPRVTFAVQVAGNLIGGQEWGASERLKLLYAQNKKGSASSAANVALVQRRRPAHSSPLPPSTWYPTHQDRERLMSFEGYGVDAPDIVFVGIEEYCDPDLTQQCESIRRRCTAPEYQGLRVDRSAALDALAGLVKTTVPVWDMMAKIMASLTGRPWESEREALGSRPAHHRPTTLLTELHALPRQGSARWQDTYLEKWFASEFSNKQEFERKSEERSGRRILQMLNHKARPSIVFFYGLPTRAWAKKWLSSLLPTTFDDEPCTITRTKDQTLLVFTGFYNGQHAATAFRENHIPDLSQRIRAVLGNDLHDLMKRAP